MFYGFSNAHSRWKSGVSWILLYEEAAMGSHPLDQHILLALSALPDCGARDQVMSQIARLADKVRNLENALRPFATVGSGFDMTDVVRARDLLTPASGGAES